MRKAKRLRFVADKRQAEKQRLALAGLQVFVGQVQQVAQALGKAVAGMGSACRAASSYAQQWAASPGVQGEVKMQNLYWQSWQRNELADTLQAAGIEGAR